MNIFYLMITLILKLLKIITFLFYKETDIKKSNNFKIIFLIKVI